VSAPDPAVLGALIGLIDETLAKKTSRPVVIGICGAQGSGKTTLAKAAAQACADKGHAATMLSIDDLYLTRAEREELAQTVHPLFVTRGPPGTHDLKLGGRLLDALVRDEAVRLPRFDKANDDRSPPDAWVPAPPACKVLLLEGWCVGARPQDESELVQPLNELEAREDGDGTWRRHVNRVLGGAYKRFFARIDKLAMLAAPGFEVVHAWRLQQEEELRGSIGSDATAVMSESEIARFIQHYERLSRHMLAEMPGRADLLIRLDAERRPLEITRSR
jgi:D-glycerate 3-kinase